jgi:hypothetical protein
VEPFLIEKRLTQPSPRNSIVVAGNFVGFAKKASLDSRASGNPGKLAGNWMPACAGLAAEALAIVSFLDCLHGGQSDFIFGKG